MKAGTSSWVVLCAALLTPACQSDYEKLQAEREAFVKANKADFVATLKRAYENPPDGLKKINKARVCDDAALEKRVESGQATLSFVHSDWLRHAVKGKGHIATVAHYTTARWLQHLEPFEYTPDGFFASLFADVHHSRISDWNGAIEEHRKRPWLAVVWRTHRATVRKASRSSDTFDAGTAGGVLAIHDPEDGKPLCWVPVDASNSRVVVTQQGRDRDNAVADDLFSNLAAQMPVELAKITKVFKVHERGVGED